MALLAKYRSADLSKLHFRCPESFFFKKNPVFEKNALLPVFEGCKNVFWVFWQKVSVVGLEIAFHVFRRFFEKKIICFWDKINFHILWLWATQFVFLAKNFSAGLSKPNFTFLVDLFADCFRNKNKYQFFSGHRHRGSSFVFWRYSFGLDVETQFILSRRNFRG